MKKGIIEKFLLLFLFSFSSTPYYCIFLIITLSSFFVHSLNMNFIENIIGDTSGAVKQLSSNHDFISIHNHPSGQTFSGNHFTQFARNSKLKMMIVAGHGGEVYVLKKNENFDNSEFSKTYMLADYGIIKYESDEELIKELTKCGVDYYKGTD